MRQKLRDLRESYGDSQQFVAEQTGTTKEYYGMIELGKRKGTLPYWLRLQAFYELSDAELWEIAKEGVKFEREAKTRTKRN